jgi:hypothetical protein
MASNAQAVMSHQLDLFDPNESLFSIPAGLAGFWGSSIDRMHVTNEALVLVRSKKYIVGRTNLSQIIDLKPKFFLNIVDYTLLFLFLPVLISRIVIKNHFELKLNDGSSQLIYIRQWGRGRWRKRLAAALEKSRASPAPAQTIVADARDLPTSLREAKTLLDRLEQLGRLRKDGVLTTEEFQSQKQKILAGV